MSTGVWVPQRGVQRLVLVDDDAPCAPERDLSQLIACPTCRATITQSCRVVVGSTKGRRRADHVLRLVSRRCKCLELLDHRHQLCEQCELEFRRQAKRDHMRRKRAAQRAATC